MLTLVQTFGTKAGSLWASLCRTSIESEIAGSFGRSSPRKLRPFVDGKLTEFVRWLGHATLEQSIPALEGTYEKKVLIDQVVYVDVE